MCVQKVCECLLRKGTLPLAQIIHFTELSKQNAVNSLLVLIQHNCVQAFATQSEGVLFVPLFPSSFRLLCNVKLLSGIGYLSHLCELGYKELNKNMRCLV